MEQLEVDYPIIDNSLIKSILKKREKFSHKGDYGHGMLVAGSYGMGGSAVLAATAALRSGLGLLTVHIPQKLYDIMQISVPEAMCSIDVSDNIFSRVDYKELNKYNTVAVGPGIGQAPKTSLALENLIKNYVNPIVLDADALNLISAHKELFYIIPENSILTPHFKEFSRMIGKDISREDAVKMQIELSINKKIIVVLKGANSSISTPDGKLYTNITGNPGMATAGSGDVLTGIILGLLTQGYTPEHAALVGVYIHSIAGDIAASIKGETSLIASDIVNYIGDAFKAVIKEMDKFVSISLNG